MNQKEKLWKEKWRIEIALQKHKEFMISKRKPYKASKEFKNFVKEFFKRNK